jgi:hypothetical protein
MCSIYDTALYCGLANKLLIQYKAPTYALSQHIPNLVLQFRLVRSQVSNVDILRILVYQMRILVTGAD